MTRPRSLRMILPALALLPIVATAVTFGHKARADAAGVVGRLESVTQDAVGNAIIAGTACRPGSRAPLPVSLYVGIAPPAGQLVASGTADQDSATAPGPCGGAGARHAFAITVPAASLFRYGGLRMYALAAAPGQPDGVPLAAAARFRFPDWTPRQGERRRCDITDIASLKSCLGKAQSYDEYAIRADLACSSQSDCCGPNGAALISLTNAAGKIIDGQDHILRREQGALQCSAIQLNKADGILVKNLSIEENPQIPPCDADTKACPPTVKVNASRNVRLDGLHVYNGKGESIMAWATDGFAFVRSSVSQSGRIGVYVGHWKYGPSKNVVIADSVIARTRTNGIALVGADASSPAEPVLVLDNVLNNNHWHGLWPAAGIRNGITSGGQILIDDGTGILVAGNLITDGACRNCNPPQTVTAIEIGEPGASGVRDLSIIGNVFDNGSGVAIHQNAGASAAGVRIIGNRLVGYRYLDSTRGPTPRERNVLQQPAPGLSRYGAATYEVLRAAAGGEHHDEVAPAEHPGARIEAVFALSPAPVPGASPVPLFRCPSAHATGDLVTADRTCGNTTLAGTLLGYSYAANTAGAKPFFSCQTGMDHFLSWDPACEGRTVLGQLGYALPRSSPSPMPLAHH